MLEKGAGAIPTYIIGEFITPHAHARAGGYVIGAGVYIYICLWTKFFWGSYFSNQLTFSNIRGWTSPRIYRQALPLRAPETLSSSSKSRIFLYNAHLALFIRMDDTITRTNASVSSKLELALEVRALSSRLRLQTRQQAELLQNWGRM